MNHPNAGLSFFPSIFLDNCEPMMIPTMAIDEMVVNNFQSIFTVFIDEKNPMSELSEMITNEVPMATFIGVLSRLTSAGMIINPPPAPTKPVKIPTTDPSPAAKRVLFFCKSDVLVTQSVVF